MLPTNPKTDQKKLRQQIKKSHIPKHIALIMDGNGRWAKAHSLSRAEGHKRGAAAVDLLMDACLDLRIPCVSLFAFSTENWRRPKTEIRALFNLLDAYIIDKLPKMKQNGIRFRVSGDISKLPRKSQRLIEDGLEQTRKNRAMLLNFCLNYGSRDEIIHAAHRMVQARAEKLPAKPSASDLKKLQKKPTAREFEKFLYTDQLPDVDLLIRTSGELRISNFLLYQCAYAELYFTDVHWPDFDESELYKSIIDFQNRQRRYGGL